MKPAIAIDPDAITDFCRRWNLVELALFGSVLSEDFRPDSDVDVLFDYGPEARLGWTALYDMEQELQRLFGRRVDLVSKRGLKKRIRDDVLATAVVLYAA